MAVWKRYSRKDDALIMKMRSGKKPASYAEIAEALGREYKSVQRRAKQLRRGETKNQKEDRAAEERNQQGGRRNCCNSIHGGMHMPNCSRGR